MNVTEFQQWVRDYYEARGWSELKKLARSHGLFAHLRLAGIDQMK